MVQSFCLRFPVRLNGYLLTVLLLLKITSLPKVLGFITQTPEIGLMLFNSSPGLVLKLHGMCKQDPLSASILFGAVTNRDDWQLAKAPVKAKAWLTTAKKSLWRETSRCTRWKCEPLWNQTHDSKNVWNDHERRANTFCFKVFFFFLPVFTDLQAKTIREHRS